jgi:GNAT superfamily N-acetyltransferase
VPLTTIRLGRPGDADAVLAMLDDAVRWLASTGRRSGRRAGRGDGLGEAPAYVLAADAPEVYVLLLVTSRAHAGRGVGAALLDHAHAEAVERGATRLRVDCWAGGDGALVRYYEAAGFMATARFTVGDWEGQLLERPALQSTNSMPLTP